MILNKNTVQTLFPLNTNHDVTSSFKIPNWHELAMHEYLLCNSFSSQNPNQNPHQQIPLLYSFIKIYDGKRTIDFSDQKAAISLTKCIMKVVFGINWSLPFGNLCPRVPNRINYLIWIHRYVINGCSMKDSKKGLKNQKDKTIVGVDIGTGASLVYPLLGNKIFDWKFIATQIDPKSITHAQSLIKINNLQTCIKIRQPQANHPQLILNALNQTEEITFLMCNPPFFDTSNMQKDPLSTMTQSQHGIEGGEYEFFFNLYVQSFHFKNVGFFTMMIGLGRNFQTIRKFLTEEHNIFGVLEQVKFGRINQAENTRFIVGWKVKKEQKKL